METLIGLFVCRMCCHFHGQSLIKDERRSGDWELHRQVPFAALLCDRRVAGHFDTKTIHHLTFQHPDNSTPWTFQHWHFNTRHFTTTDNSTPWTFQHHGQFTTRLFTTGHFTTMDNSTPDISTPWTIQHQTFQHHFKKLFPVQNIPNSVRLLLWTLLKIGLATLWAIYSSIEPKNYR